MAKQPLDPGVRLTMYIQDDAERWRAAHARLDALAELVFILTCVVSAAGLDEGLIHYLDAAEELSRKYGEHLTVRDELRAFRKRYLAVKAAADPGPTRGAKRKKTGARRKGASQVEDF